MAAQNLTIKTKSGVCKCGCGEETSPNTRSEFRQGHDARLKGVLATLYNTGGKVVIQDTETGTTNQPVTVKAFAKSVFSDKGVASLLALAEKRKENDAAKASKAQASKARATAAAAATPEGGKPRRSRSRIKQGTAAPDTAPAASAAPAAPAGEVEQDAPVAVPDAPETSDSGTSAVASLLP